MTIRTGHRVYITHRSDGLEGVLVARDGAVAVVQFPGELVPWRVRIEDVEPAEPES